MSFVTVTIKEKQDRVGVANGFGLVFIGLRNEVSALCIIGKNSSFEQNLMLLHERTLLLISMFIG